MTRVEHASRNKPSSGLQKVTTVVQGQKNHGERIALLHCKEAKSGILQVGMAIAESVMEVAILMQCSSM